MRATLASIAWPSSTLAQSGAGSAAMWIAALVLVAVLGGVALFWIRRLLLSEEPPASATGLTLQDVREMHQRGVMSDEEFAAAKRVILGAAGEGSGPSRNPITGVERDRPKR